MDSKLQEFLNSSGLIGYLEEFKNNKINYNQILRCPNLNIFENIFENQFHFNIFKTFVELEIKKIDSNHLNSNNDNVPAQVENVPAQVENEQQADENNVHQETADSNADNGHILIISQVDNLTSQFDNDQQENANPAPINRRKFWHIGKLDDLIEDINDRLTIKEIKNRIKLYLETVLNENQMQNFNNVDGKIILGMIFGALTYKHAFLREENKSGFVNILK